MTNREAHEKAAGMALEPMFFVFNGIDLDAEVEENAEAAEGEAQSQETGAKEAGLG